jgi:cell division cycle 20-like protein 1, cofactor of APC complex
MRNYSSHHSPSSLAQHSPSHRFSSSPSRKSPLVYGDRFIPSRVSSHLDSGLLSMSSPGVNNENENRPIHSLIRSELLGQSGEMSSGHRSQQNSTSSVLRYQSSVDDIQRYATQIPSPAESANSASPYRPTSMPTMGSPSRISNSFDPSSTSLGGSAKKPKRNISRVPYKVLDAPSLQDDFYLNLVDWSKSNVLAVALGNSVFLWSAYTSKVSLPHLCGLTFSLLDARL